MWLCNPVTVTDDYFNETTVNRERLLWTIATRRQLERWEAILARVLRDSAAGPPDNADIWAAEIERHFALVAARHLFRALDLPPASSVSVDATLRDELIEGRNLHEHWPENVPVFNVTPRVAQPRYPSGQRFAARNPGATPYSWLHWNSKTGALLLPNVPSPKLHEVLDAVKADVLAADDAFSAFVPPRTPSPWLQTDDGEWWPKSPQ
jgi:hypothetical protein